MFQVTARFLWVSLLDRFLSSASTFRPAITWTSTLAVGSKIFIFTFTPYQPCPSNKQPTTLAKMPMIWNAEAHAKVSSFPHLTVNTIANDRPL